MRVAARGLVPVLMALVLLAGCGSDGGDEAGTSNAGGAGASPSQSAEGPGPSDTPDPALAGSPTPTLPEGDPGTDDSGADAGDAGDADDGAVDDAHGEDEMHDAVVPQAAVLDAETVGSVAGGSWTEGGEVGDCVEEAAHDAVATRGAVLGSTEGNLTQLVGAYKSKGDAVTAVAAGGRALTGCGFTETGDPRLGDASLELTREATGAAPERAVLVAAEGALVVLVADGAAAAPGAWESLADLALGTSCAAGVHGCH